MTKKLMGALGAGGAEEHAASASAMAAMAIPPSEEVDDGSYAEEPDAAVPIAKATRLPRNRVRRALRDRDFATIARRDGPVIAAPSDGAAAVPDPTGTAATEAFAAGPAAGCTGPSAGCNCCRATTGRGASCSRVIHPVGFFGQLARAVWDTPYGAAYPQVWKMRGIPVTVCRSVAMA